ncbi:unnamed protein product [Strongylus vulgaris]|uniref:non-specific serine/threonine protein kinase n=1 Tax=Strongylus vulgaris TaxID=40348 RepID=A0A3P7L3S9_STRVU|nr:unnamed protein product [Strongylus vulgaris]
MRNELKGIVKAKELGVATPAVYFVDAYNNKIIMERVEGCTANYWIESRRLKEGDSAQPRYFLVLLLPYRITHIKADNLEFAKALGEAVAKMHLGNLVHGDLTTSNVIVKDNNFKKPIFIDFGLSSLGKVLPEDKGVDLYVLERAMISTHIDSEEMFESVLEGYRSFNTKQALAVIKLVDFEMYLFSKFLTNGLFFV